ncbi:nucleoside/nucleotide kinase family protein [Georgenia sp. SYP-B2076]|uniref:nucleoside/nucleotide kinase family protein n=1 Tax=Georgenia sp. SYP-B2076 TaxID=2495881 RepID=UPI000F8CC2EC|nr:nucleoside/nucleotide kinase family protein [Georgenia sp. SYP-B2076]
MTQPDPAGPEGPGAAPSVVLSATPSDVSALVARVQAVVGRGGPGRAGRALIGIVGAPGAGKSTLTAVLARALADAGTASVVVGMDGFHLAQAELDRLGRADRKGAPDTFDAEGYVALVRRIRVQRPGAPAVYAPRFDRGLEEPVGSAVPVFADTPVVLTEGNYLLLGAEPWHRLRRLLDETWFVEVDEGDRRRRLLDRHLSFGRPRELAEAFAHGSDERNAHLVAATRGRADLVVRWG